MEKLRSKLGGGSFLILALAIGVSLDYFFHIGTNISTTIGIAVVIAAYYVIDKLADLQVLERITAQQNAFNKEFDYFKTMYVYQLEKTPFLYPLIDQAQANTLDLCRRYPDKYKDTTDFRTPTIQTILSLFYGYVYANRYSYMLESNVERTQKLIEDIKRRERLS